MRISEKWLREWVDPDLPLTEICDQLTNAGLEVDGVESIGGNFSGVLVGEVTEISQHPSAEHLTLCTVSTGNGSHQVVCGAPNVAVGMKSAYAARGARLPEGRVVSEATIQGVKSEGMLCSGLELGLDSDGSGILKLGDACVLGTKVAEVLRLDDQCIEIDLTPNRGDCFSVRGVAREVGVANHLPIVPPAIDSVDPTIDATLPIELVDPDGCPIYLGRIIKGVSVNAVVPLWLSRRLLASGLRPINAIVDVLNYVMLELGQPMHAFDLDQVADGVSVRYARNGEELKLLDGTEAKLENDDLLITSGGTPVAIAGVIGGLDSGVTEETSDVLLECAFFTPSAIFGTARKYGLQTDASTRYERGVDFALQDVAIERATRLILDIAGGDAGHVIDVRSASHIPTQNQVSIGKARLAHLIGQTIDDETVRGIFERLEFDPTETADSWTVTSPTFRFDIAIEVDLVEEVCRIYGYDRIDTHMPNAQLDLNEVASVRGDATYLRAAMRSMGYNETVTYSFIDRERNLLFGGTNNPPTLQNPMSSDREVMRGSLLPGLLDVVAYNAARQHTHIRVFEYGQCFSYESGNLTQFERIAGVAWGNRDPELWGNDKAEVDFFDVKADVEELLPTGRVKFRESAAGWLRGGFGAEILLDGEVVGSVGQIEPKMQSSFGIDGSVFGFECLAGRLEDKHARLAQPISAFPSIRRDLALVLDEAVSTADIEHMVSQVMGELLTEFTVFDVFRGKQAGKGKKSLGIGMSLQLHDRSLLDSEANEKIDELVAELQSNFDAQLR